jgi:hypothetical protein
VKDPKKIFAVALAVVVFVLFPLKVAKDHGDATKRKTAAVDQHIADKDHELATARKAVAAKPDNTRALELLSTRMPAKADEEGFIQQLEDLATQTGVEWISASFVTDTGVAHPATTLPAAPTTTVAGTAKPVGTNAAAEKYPSRVSSSFLVAIEVRGSYDGQMAYLQKIRSIDRLFTIDKLDLNPEAPTGASPAAPTPGAADPAAAVTLKASIGLRVYTWAEGVAAPDASAAANVTKADGPATTATVKS